MAHFLFIDESGGNESDYDVLAGVAVEDRDLWNLILALQDAEERNFGRRYTSGEGELKARKILKTKTFRLARLADISGDAPRELAKRALDEGESAGLHGAAALSKAKIKYTQEVLDICARFHCKAFASIVRKNLPTPRLDLLRKDYAYLFERFFYYLEDRVGDPSSFGIIVFDELEKSQSHILVDQMDSYFKRTDKGRQRAGQIIPEPFFVHSDLTTGIQLADLVAYIISWGVRFEGMDRPARPELKEFADQVLRLRTFAIREVAGDPNYRIWSFAVISDLRSRGEQE